MPVVGDFIEIQGDAVEIGSDQFERPFNTGGRTGETALLLFNVRGLTRDSVEVKVNDRVVDDISPNSTENREHWYTQMVTLEGSDLKNGNNDIEIDNQLAPAENFFIKNVVCFFHQNA